MVILMPNSHSLVAKLLLKPCSPDTVLAQNVSNFAEIIIMAIKLSCLPRGVQLQIENLSVMSGSMVQFRANSLSLTHIALCDFNLSIVTGKSIVTEGAGGG